MVQHGTSEILVFKMKTYNLVYIEYALTKDGIAGLLEIGSNNRLYITNYKIIQTKTVIKLLRLNFGGIWANKSIVEYSERQLLRNDTFS